jgi:hypothetical protein
MALVFCEGFHFPVEQSLSLIAQKPKLPFRLFLFSFGIDREAEHVYFLPGKRRTPKRKIPVLQICH